MRGGGINPSNTNKFDGAGQGGYYWSSRAFSGTAYAYSFNFNTGVYPSFNFNRYYGRSLRCLIPTT